LTSHRVLLPFTVLGATALGILLYRCATPAIYTDDFVCDYAAGTAIAEGANPYTVSVGELVTRHVPGVVALPEAARFPLPHPPLGAVLMAPLAALPYPIARLVWMAGDLMALVLLARWSGVHGWLLPLALVAWPPVTAELRWGNWSLIVAALCIGAWRWRERAALGGVLLGAAVALKLYPAPLVGFAFVLGWRRLAAWAIVASAFLTIAPAALDPSIVSAYGTALHQVFHSSFLASPSAAASSYSTVARVAPFVPPLTGIAVVFTTLVLTTLDIRRLAPDLRFGLACCATLAAVSMVCEHYLVLLLYPMAVAMREVAGLAFPPALRRFGFIAFVLLCLPHHAVAQAAAFAGASLLLVLPAGPILLATVLTSAGRSRSTVLHPEEGFWSRATGPGVQNGAVSVP
jgi:hypothetical protein